MTDFMDNLAHLARTAPPEVLNFMADAVNIDGGADLGRVDERDMRKALDGFAKAILAGADPHAAVIGYMCTIDFEDELGAASGGNKVYPSVEDLKRHHPTWESCGIVEVEVRCVRTVARQDLGAGPTPVTDHQSKA